jgi:hypothetical protein
LVLCYQVKMEGRLISQHSLRQHVKCDYLAQAPSRDWPLQKRGWRNYRASILTQHSWVCTKAP